MNGSPVYIGRVVCTQPQGSCFLPSNICCYQNIKKLKTACKHQASRNYYTEFILKKKNRKNTVQN